MRERPEVAQRRKALSHAVGVLNRALQQLQAIPRELDAHAASSAEADGGVSAMARLAPRRSTDAPSSNDAGAVAARSMHMYRSMAMSTLGRDELGSPTAAAADAAAS